MKILIALAVLIIILIAVLFVLKNQKQAKLTHQPKSIPQDTPPPVIKQIEPTVEIQAQPEQAVAVAVEDSATIQEQFIPQDSMLRRHYFATQAATQLAITHPYPSDSALRRHYESALRFLLDAPVKNAQPLVKDNVDIETATTLPESTPVETATIVEDVLITAAPVQFASSDETTVSKLRIPEDSTLRRHFLTQIRMQIEKSLAPKPTDATLKRHYENLIAAKLDNFLNGYAS